MPHYVIELPEGLELLVGVNNYPVDFKIFFPNGKSVDFSFGAAPKPHSSVKVAKGLHEAKEEAEAATPLRRSAGLRRKYSKSVVSQSPAGRPTIRYADQTNGSRPLGPQKTTLQGKWQDRSRSSTKARKLVTSWRTHSCVPCRDSSRHLLLHHRLINQRPCLPPIWHVGSHRNLDHQHRHQLLLRIDPEVCAHDASPREVPHRPWHRIPAWIRADRETQPEAGAHLGCGAERVQQGRDGGMPVRRWRELVGGHQRHCLRGEYAHAVEFTAVEHRLAETRIVARG